MCPLGRIGISITVRGRDAKLSLLGINLCGLKTLLRLFYVPSVNTHTPTSCYCDNGSELWRQLLSDHIPSVGTLSSLLILTEASLGGWVVCQPLGAIWDDCTHFWKTFCAQSVVFRWRLCSRKYVNVAVSQFNLSLFIMYKTKSRWRAWSQVAISPSWLILRVSYSADTAETGAFYFISFYFQERLILFCRFGRCFSERSSRFCCVWWLKKMDGRILRHTAKVLV